MKTREGKLVVGVLFKGVGYLFASWWHFACLPNSCCGLSSVLAWLTALLWLYRGHIWPYTEILPTDAFTATHVNIPPGILFLLGWRNSLLYKRIKMELNV